MWHRRVLESHRTGAATECVHNLETALISGFGRVFVPVVKFTVINLTRRIVVEVCVQSCYLRPCRVQVELFQQDAELSFVELPRPIRVHQLKYFKHALR